MVLYGSCMSILVHVILPNDASLNLAQLWKDIQELYDALQIPLRKRFGNMRMSMFSKARLLHS